VAAAVVVAQDPPEQLTSADSVVGPALVVLQDLAFQGGVDRLGEAVVGARADRSDGLGDPRSVQSWA
jgi:hypothetical protein